MKTCFFFLMYPNTFCNFLDTDKKKNFPKFESILILSFFFSSFLTKKIKKLIFEEMINKSIKLDVKNTSELWKTREKQNLIRNGKGNHINN